MANQNRDVDRTASPVNERGASQLVHASDIDHFEIAKGEPDPRGWDVRTSDGTKLGKVEDLIYETRGLGVTATSDRDRRDDERAAASGERRLRYVEVRTNDDVRKAGGRDYALVPVGRAHLDDSRDDVIVDLTLDDLRELPPYEARQLSRDYETSLRGRLRDRARRGTAAAADVAAASSGTTADREADFYSGPDYDDRRFFGTRRRVEEGSGAADRATTTGLADRVTDAADNLKDRVDANPASRPGPDATDRKI